MKKRFVMKKIMAVALAVMVAASCVPSKVVAEELSDESEDILEDDDIALFGGENDASDSEDTITEGENTGLGEECWNNTEEEYSYMDSNMRLSWGTVSKDDVLNYQVAKFSNVGQYAHSFTINCTNWDMWDVKLPKKNIINPNEILEINIRPNLKSPKWKTGEYAEALTISAFDSDGCVITDNASVNLYITIQNTSKPRINRVTVFPREITLAPGQNFSFSADVDGGNGADLGVNWNISGQTSSSTYIKNGTLYLGADEKASIINITAVSRQDSSYANMACVYIEQKKTAVTVQPLPIDGGVAYGSGTYSVGDTCVLNATPSNGYSFEGWYDSANKKVSSKSDYSFVVKGSDYYVARFVQNMVRVHTRKNIDNGGDISESQNVIYGGSVTVSAKARDGYVFDGWYDGNNKLTSSNEYTLSGVTSERKLTAVFVQNKFNVTVSANPADGGTVSGGGSFEKGKSTKLTAKPAKGYKFVAWILNNEVISKNSEFTLANITRDYILSALFQKEDAKLYTVAITSDTGHGITNPGGNIKVEQGKTLAIAISADADYTISDVKVDGKSVGAVTSYSFYNVENNHTMVVSFKPVKTESSSKKDDNTTGTGQSTNARVDATGAGTGVEVTTTPSSESYTPVENTTEIIALGGSLQDLNITEDEARYFIQNGNDRMLMENALLRGDLEVTVVNRYASVPKETAEVSYYEIQSVPNFEDVLDSVLNENDKLSLFGGNKIRSNLNICEIEQINISDEEKSVLYQIATVNGITLCSYFDVQFIIEVDGIPKLVTNLDTPMKVLMNVPEDIGSVDSSKLCILRSHDGVVDILGNEINTAGSIMFSTDKMSTFAIGYYNSQGQGQGVAGNTVMNNQNPANVQNAKDKNVIIFLIGVIVVGSIAIVITVFSSGRKKKKHHK